MNLKPDPIILSFNASLVSQNRDDCLRQFLVAYFVDEQSFSVVEKVVPNSGFPGGKFISKTKFNNPKTGKPYVSEEISIDSDIVLGGWVFHLDSATEGTLKYMEAHSDVFEKSDLFNCMLPIITKLKSIKNIVSAAFKECDTQKRGRVKNSDVERILAQFDVTLTKQGRITLFRRFQFADSDLFLYNEFLALI